MSTRKAVWVKLDGWITAEPDVISTWAIGSPRPGVEAALRALNDVYDVIVYGTPLFSPRGQRAAQRWLVANGLADYVFDTSYEQTPPTGVEVRDKWESTTTEKASPSSNSGRDNPATGLSTMLSVTSGSSPP